MKRVVGLYLERRILRSDDDQEGCFDEEKSEKLADR